MKINVVYLLLIATLGLTVFASIAQQNQNVPKTDTEVEKLKIQLQTAENEKIELETKLAEANAKLINADFGKFERELRDSNNKWLWGWTTFFVGVVAVIGLALWFFVKSLIADRVEKNLKGFQEAVGNFKEIKDQLVILEEGYTYTVLRNLHTSYFWSQNLDFKEIKGLRDETLLRILDDKTYSSTIRYKAVAVLAARNSTQLVTPALKLLNTFVNSELDSDDSFDSQIDTENSLRRIVSIVGQIHTQDSYEGLKKFLISLITDNPKNKDIFLTYTAFSLSWISIKLNMEDSTSVLRLAIPHLQVGQSDLTGLQNSAKYFDIFKQPEGIKEIYNIHAKGKMPELEETCLNLLDKYDPDFVKEQRKEKAANNTEGEINEPEPTE